MNVSNISTKISECISKYNETYIKNTRHLFAIFFFFSDNSLDFMEFEQLLKHLFYFSGNSYFMQKPNMQSIFNKFDTNKVIFNKERAKII